MTPQNEFLIAVAVIKLVCFIAYTLARMTNPSH